MPSHIAAIKGVCQVSGGTCDGLHGSSSSVWFVPEPHKAPSCSEESFLVDAGTGGSTMLMLQALLPVMLARSASCGQAVQVTLQGGTNVISPDGQVTAPQVEYVQLVLFPMLRRLFGITVEMDVHKKGFANGGGEVVIVAAAPCWPLQPIELLDTGVVRSVCATAFSSTGVPPNVLNRMVEGSMKKRAAGASVVLKEHLPETQVLWNSFNCPSANGSDACGVVVAIHAEHSIFGGDSMGRKGTSAERVGEEAVRKGLDFFHGGGAVDGHLEDQLVVFMALAKGCSRLRLGKATRCLHLQTALWLAQQFGASARVVQDCGNAILELHGVGSTLESSR
ncbi:RTCA [Symbiodinium pilosum]|uniref:RTCA protein n=1 Tax=Symbiodinium pilosum TaxID=2952 RepID=A0A812T3J9_SYMPI|nr:RTCA [Symbiodinium pilosum]